MATPEQIYAALKKADAAGNTGDARILAQAYQAAIRPAAPPTPAPVAAPQKKEGFFGAFGRSFKEGAGTLSYADEAAAYAQKKDDASRKALLEASKSNAPEGKQGLGAYLGELAGGSVGQMVAPGLAGLGAATATGLTGVGLPLAPAAGIAAGSAVNTAQYAAQNMRRQALEQEQALREGRAATGPDGGKALLAAVPQAALDTVGGKVFGPLLSKFPILRNLAIPGGRAEKAFAEVLSKGAFEQVGGGIVRGVAGGAAFEVPQEIAQQALERWQAGLPLSGKDAMEEYKSAAVGALVLGGGVGGVQGAVVSTGERAAALKEKDAAEAAANAPAAIAPLAGTGNLPPETPPAGSAPTSLPAKVTTKMVEDSEEYQTRYDQGFTARKNKGATDAEAREKARTAALKSARRTVEAEMRAAAAAPPVNVAPPAPSPVAVANAKQLVVDTFNDQSSDFEGPDGVVVPLTPEQLDYAAGLTAVGEDPRGAIDRAKEAVPNETPTTGLDLGAAELGADGGGGNQGAGGVAPVVPGPVVSGVDLGGADAGTSGGAAGDVNNPVVEPAPTPEVLPPTDVVVEAAPEPVEPVAKPLTPEKQALADRPDVKTATELVKNAFNTDERFETADIAATPDNTTGVSPKNAIDTAITQATRDARNPEIGKPWAQYTPEDFRGLVLEKLKSAGYDFKDKPTPKQMAASYAPALENDKQNANKLPYQLVVNGQRAGVYYNSPADASAEITQYVNAKPEARSFADDFVPVETKAAPAPAAAEQTEEKTLAPKRAMTPEAIKARAAALAAKRAPKEDTAATSAYDEDGLSFSPGSDDRIIGLVRDWKKLFLKNAKIHVATAEEAKKDPVKYAKLKPDEMGSAQRVGDNEYYIIYTPGDVLETTELLAHEMGHVLQREAFDGADAKLKNELFAAHKAWLETEKAAPASTDKAYRESFAEWFADQTASWAASDARPQSAIERFFKGLGEQLMKFFTQNKSYLPNEKFKTFIERVVRPEDFSDYKLGRGKWSGTEKPQAAKRRATGKASTMATVKKVAASQTPEAKLSAAIKSSLTSFDDLLRLYNVLKDTISIPVLNRLLGMLATSQVVKLAAKSVPPLQRIVDAVEDLNSTRHRRLTELVDKSTWWGDFARKDPKGAADLADIMHLSTLLGVDPTKFASLTDAKKGDIALSDLRAELVNATGPKRARVQKALKEREANLKLVYEGGTMTDKDGTTYTVPGWMGLSGRGAKATVDVRILGDDMLKPEKDTYEKRSLSEAQRIYVMVKNTYEDNLRDHVKALTDVVDKSGVDEDQRKKSIKDITATYEEEYKRGVYFPLTRSGEFWLRVGETFKTFDTRLERDLERERAIKQDGRDAEAMFKDKTIDEGDDASSLRDSVAESSEVLKKLMEAVNGLNDVTVADAKESFAELAYQIYLKSLPQGDLRARFSHRKGTAGFSPDALRGFVNTQYASANQISRLEHADTIRGAVSGARKFLDGNANKTRLMPFVKEMDLRAQAELTPAPLTGDSLDRIASGVNKAVFFMMLTSPKSALIQFTQLPIVGVPVLSAAYGTGKAVAMVGKYMNVFGKLKPATRTVPGMAPGEETVRWDELNMADSDYNKSLSPEKRELLEHIHAYASSRGMFSDTYAADANNQRNTRTEDYTGAGGKVSRKVVSFITGGFHQVERMTRQIMVMSAGELEYNKLRANGVTHKAAMDKAARAAVDTTHQAMFNYTTFEKPRYFQKGVGRMAFQFMTFPLHMIGYLGVNFVDTFKGDTPELRKEAATRFFGTMGMTAMFGGTTALPFYSAVMGMLSAIRDQFTDDEDDEDEDGNPLGMRNMDLWFRLKFIPTMFGPGSDFALSTGMSDEQANLMVRSLLMGPLSALSGMNLGASTSLDFFKNDAPEARNSAEAIQRTFFTTVLGPSGSLALNLGRSVEDIQAGEVMRGIERSAPAFFRGAMTSARYAKEGALTPDKAEMKSAEYFTTGKLMYQALGFGDTELADIQKTNITTKSLVEDIKREKNKLLDRMDKAQFRYDANPTDANDARIEAVWEDIDAYNEKNWDLLPIKPSTVTRSLKGRDESREESIDGLVIGDKKLRNAAEDLLESVR